MENTQVSPSIAEQHARNKNLPRKVFMENELVENLNLRERVIQHADFLNCVITKADASNSIFRNCLMSDLRFNFTLFSNATFRLCNFTKVDFLSCKLNEIKLENCIASGVTIHTCEVNKASLIESDFSRCCIKNTRLQQIDATGAIFRGADMKGIDFIDVNFSEVDLRGANLSMSIIRNASFRDADLRGADFSGAHIESADFTGADLRGAIFDVNVEAALRGEQNNNQPPAELIEAVTPIVASLLKQAERNGTISGDKWMDELQHMLATLGAASLDEKKIAIWDEQVSFWLNQAGKIGVQDLFASLRSKEEKTPAVIASMLEQFVKDLGLQPGVSTRELVEELFTKLQKP